MLQDFTPQQICAEIGLCTSVSEVVMTVQDTKCVLCEYVMKTLDDLLANNATEAEIKTALEVSSNIFTIFFIIIHSQTTEKMPFWGRMNMITDQLKKTCIG